MSTFEELKQKAQVQVKSDEAAVQGWVKGHRVALIVGLMVGIVAGWLIAHA